jgi:glucosamine kinase
VELAFHGAFPDGDGILVLAGTGSMAMCQSAVGLVRAGGWGDMFGDEGSAFWIGRSALQWASQMRDGRIADTGFADLLSEKLAIPQSDGFFGLSVWAMKPGHARSRIAAISLMISALADKGDVTSGLIIDSAAAELALHVQAVARLAQKPSGTPWTHAGSVFRSARLTAKLSVMLGHAPALAQFDALGGGLWQAAKAAGWPVDAAFRNQIKAGLGPKATA